MCADRSHCCAGLFWLQAGQTNTVYGAQNSNGSLFFLMMFCSMRRCASLFFILQVLLVTCSGQTEFALFLGFDS